MSVAAPPRPTAPLPSRYRPAGGLLVVWDVLFKLLCQSCAVLIIGCAFLLVAILLARSWLAISSGSLQFFGGDDGQWLQTRWRPEGKPPIFGALPYVYGTIATSVIAMIFALPLGIGTAAFLSEIASTRLKRVASFFIEMLAAIPSVVYGFWGLLVLAPFMQQELFDPLGGPNVGGKGLLTAGIILAIMIVPYITAISYDVCQSVPRAQREGSLSLGATRWQTIYKVVLPYARPGIIAGVFLALGRALGETMAVTMLIGNKGQISLSPYASGASIASVLANQYQEATSDLHRSVLVELGLLLLLVTAVINAVARWFLWRLGRPRPTRPSTTLPRESTVVDSTPLPAPASSWQPKTRWLSAEVINHAMTVLLGLCVAITMGLLVVILTFLFLRGYKALDWDFFTKLPGRPGDESGVGLANAILGSFKLVGFATFFAVPIGLLAAVYLAEYRPSFLSRSTRFIAELLAGVPSIIIGIFAAVAFDFVTYFLTSAVQHPDALLRLVGRVRACRVDGADCHAGVGGSASAGAKGAARRQSRAGKFAGAARLRVSLPAALAAVVTGVFLSIARIAGETAPLLLTAGNSNTWPRSLTGFTPNLPYYIYNYGSSGVPHLVREAWAAAFVLMVVVLLLNFGIRIATGKRQVAAARGE